jgi:hypothetical protein
VVELWSDFDLAGFLGVLQGYLLVGKKLAGYDIAVYHAAQLWSGGEKNNLSLRRT